MRRSTLQRKDRGELNQIAAALGAKPSSRARKDEIIQLIIDLTADGARISQPSATAPPETAPSAPAESEPEGRPAHNAVMRHMRAHHEEVPVPDGGVHAAAPGARIHGDMLADDISGADLQRRRLIGIFEVLRRMPDRCEREYPCVRANGCASRDNDMGVQNAAIAESDFPAHMAKRPDLHAFAECRALLDNSARMDGARHHNPWIIALYSDSATRTPSTLASPRNRHTAPR